MPIVRRRPKPSKKSPSKKPKPAVSRSHRAISPAASDAEATYPISEWMVPATDTHGHSAKVFTRLPPSYVHQMNSILQTKKFPLDTTSDMVRLAVHRLLSEMAKVADNPDITSQQAILNSLVEMSSRQMEYAHFSDALEKLTGTVSDLMQRDAEPMARKMVREIRDQVDRFEDPWWKERYTKQLLDKWSGLLK